MRVIVKMVDQEPFETDVPNELKPLQGLVGGHIECVRGVFENFGLLVDEEGLIKRKKYNCTFLGKPLFGTIVAVGVKGEDFTDCPILLDTFKGMYHVEDE
jgi:hypothetical protein